MSDSLRSSQLMDKRQRARLFRQRLENAIKERNISRSELTRLARIDRSTLSALLFPHGTRLPNGQIIAGISSALNVSADWLLGLTSEQQGSAEILEASLQITGVEPAPIDANMIQWQREAAGYKIRHVPLRLPDLIKTGAVIDYEYSGYSTKTAQQARSDAKNQIDVMKQPETEFEICLPFQTFQSFAAGEQVWGALSPQHRYEQITYACELLDAFYPTVRIFLYDGLNHFLVPCTIMGPLRAVIFAGPAFFVFNTTVHIRALSQYFDLLIRHASVHPHEVTGWLRKLLDSEGLKL